MPSTWRRATTVAKTTANILKAKDADKADADAKAAKAKADKDAKALEAKAKKDAAKAKKEAAKAKKCGADCKPE